MIFTCYSGGFRCVVDVPTRQDAAIQTAFARAGQRFKPKTMLRGVDNTDGAYGIGVSIADRPQLDLGKCDYEVTVYEGNTGPTEGFRVLNPVFAE